MRRTPRRPLTRGATRSSRRTASCAVCRVIARLPLEGLHSRSISASDLRPGCKICETRRARRCAGNDHVLKLEPSSELESFERPIPQTLPTPEPTEAVSGYLRARSLWLGRQRTADADRVPRHTLLRFPLTDLVSARLIEAVTGDVDPPPPGRSEMRQTGSGRVERGIITPKHRSSLVESEMLRLHSATPFATVAELATFTGMPDNTRWERMSGLSSGNSPWMVNENRLRVFWRLQIDLPTQTCHPNLPLR